jgi:hypothetical protein
MEHTPLTIPPGSPDPDPGLDAELHARQREIADWLFTTAILLGDQGYDEDEELLARAGALVNNLSPEHFRHPYGKPTSTPTAEHRAAEE